jgi:isoquinoline 1-oxidoreductase beta subunit
MATARAARDAAEAAFAPNAFVRIAPDDVVTVVCKHLEMGQGTYTGLSTLVAEELDARWEQMRPIGAPADVERYNNLLWGQAQGTGGSTAIANAFEQMRRAGATARAMLVAAAAERWRVPADEIEVADGVLRHAPSGRQASLGAMAEAAAEQPVPDHPQLKDPSRFRLIGKARLPRLDGPDKVAGRALFTQDVRLPNMLIALIAHPPRFGARAAGVDDRAALDVEGVVKVVRVPSGVAVLALDFWSAQRGRAALRIDWDEREAFRGSSEALLADYRARAAEPGLPARSDGDAAAALADAETRIEAEFTFPYLAHAAMEPLDCVIERTPDGGVRVINGEQFQTVDQAAIAEVLGLPPEKVALQMLYAGGSFGRRANPASDYLVEAAQIFKAHGGSTPIKLIWTREDDMRAGWYRPLYLHRLRARLDADGRPVGWEHRIVGQSIMAGTPMAGRMIEDGVDRTSVEGAADLPYAIPNLAVELHTTEVPVPVQWWRSVGSTHTGFATECMIDELATAAGADPVAFRLRLLEDHPRHRGVLELAAEKAG